MSVAKKLRLLRRIRGLTLEDLSEKAGISVSYLSRIESGNRRVTESLLFKLSELLECDPAEILADEPPEKQIASLGFTSLSLNRKNSTEKVSELMSLLEKVADQLQDNTVSTQTLPVFTTHYFKNKVLPIPSPATTTMAEGLPLEEPIEWVPCPPELAHVKTAFAYYIVSEDMAPRYNPGDVVFVNPQKPLMPGCFVLVLKQDNTTHTRQFVQSYNDRFIFKICRTNQEETLSISEIKGVYRIVGSRETV